ncbi:MAG: PH domain-containing protein [bacterium]|jgi:membrane protein YdbS with pleckstrin-like domain|nr:PH domain-containing protein [bacterium]
MDIQQILDPNEKIMWQGKPNFLAFCIRSVPAMIFGVFWSLFLVPFYWAWWTGKFPIFVWAVLGPHTLVALGLLTAPLFQIIGWKYVSYAITNKRVIVQQGIIGRGYNLIDFDKISDVNVHIGVLEKITKTGSIQVVAGMGMTQPNTTRNALVGIENPYEVFKLLKKLYFDIKTDIEYPNKLRPETNPGYNTEYSKNEKQ